jgi:hypothetical protein
MGLLAEVHQRHGRVQPKVPPFQPQWLAGTSLKLR